MSDTIRDLLRAAGERKTVTITTEADVILDAIDALNHLAQHALDDCGHQAITRAEWRYSHRRLVEAAVRATGGSDASTRVDGEQSKGSVIKNAE